MFLRIVNWFSKVLNIEKKKRKCKRKRNICFHVKVMHIVVVNKRGGGCSKVTSKVERVGVNEPMLIH